MIIRLLVLTVLALFGGVALAQEAGVPDAGVAAWFASAAAFAAAVIVPVVAFLKRHVLKDLHDWGTIAISFGLGLAGGIAGSFAGYLENIQAGLAFGASAALIASGGWDAVSGLLGKRREAS